MDSILDSVKKQLASDDYFDPDLILVINTAFSILTQIGVGPSEGFSIEDDSETWSDYTKDEKVYNMVKTYITLKAKLYFDISTASSVLIDTWNKQCEELEWRLNAEADYNKKGEES